MILLETIKWLMLIDGKKIGTIIIIYLKNRHKK